MRGLGSWRQFRLGLALVVFAVTIILLIGGQGLAKSVRVDRPLARELDSIAGVLDHALAQGTDGAHLELTLARVPDLEQTITRVLAAVAERQEEPVVEVVIHDHRQGLGAAYYDLRFGLEEAMATGRYTALQKDLHRLARQYHLDRALAYLGQGFVYVQLEQGSAYLYQVLPRPEREAQPAAEGGGG